MKHNGRSHEFQPPMHEGPSLLRMECTQEYVEEDDVKVEGVVRSPIGVPTVRFLCPRCLAHHESPRYVAT